MRNRVKEISVALKKSLRHAPATATPQTRAIGMARAANLALGPALLIATILLPLPLMRNQQHLLGVILFTVAYWSTRPVPIPMTSMLALALAAMLGVAPTAQVFSAFSSPIVFLLIGELIVIQSMIKYGLGRRIALRVLSLPGVAHTTYGIVIVFGAVAATLASIINSAAVAATLFPIAIGLVQALSPAIASQTGAANRRIPLRFSTALMLMTAYGAVVGGLTTPFGDASNLVGWFFIQEHFHVAFPVGTWMALSLPIVLTQFALISLIVLLVNRPEVARLPTAASLIRLQSDQLGAMSRGEKNTAIAFGAAVFLWLLPTIVGAVAGYSSPLYDLLLDRLSPAVGAILAATLLFVLPVSRSDGFTLRWSDAKKMDWGPVLLVGTSVALGKLMATTGLAQVAGDVFANHIAGAGAGSVYLSAASIAILFSELTTNLASVSVLVPIIPTLAQSGGGNPIEATLIATFAGIYGFALPISTSANAIVYASGEIPFMRMVKTGLLVDLSGVAVVVTGVTTVFYLMGSHIT